MTAQAETQILQLNLLRTPEIYLDHQPLTLGTAKARALLFYLAVTGQPHSRATLIDLLWGEMPETNARRNLTATLANLRKVLSPFLEVESDRVAWRRDAPYQLDVKHFEDQLTQGQSTLEMRLVRDAVTLYRGEFLTGLEVKDAYVFEEWLSTERERLRERLLQALQLLVDHAVGHNDYASGLDYAHQLLNLDPWREAAHRQLMQLHAQQGRREAALTQYETCRQLLAQELGVDPSPDTQALHMQLLEADATPNHNIPPPTNSFVGRAAEIEQLTQMLDSPDCRLLTIVGPGGMGKTRLALEVARTFVNEPQHLPHADFPDGIYLIPLASVSAAINQGEAEPFIIAMAKAMGLEFRGTATLRTQLLSDLVEKAILLVCDNFEHLLAADVMQPELNLVAEILQQSPQVKLLVTSRVRLKLQEEWPFEVTGLAYPLGEGWRREPLTTLPAYGAVDLFLQRAEQVQMGFSLTEQDAPSIVCLCQLLAGHPLALELAASWLSALSCGEIVAEVEAGMDFLSANLHQIPERHRSMEAVFEHSWRLLAAEEQQVLSKLTVFVGGFTRESASKVAGASLRMVMRLADKSLLQRMDETNGVRRYTMHPLIHRFVEEKLFTDPQAAAQALHTWCCYFGNAVQALDDDLLNDNQAAAYAWIHQEIHNLHAAWVYACEAEPFDMAVKFVDGLGNYYATRAQYQRGLHFMTQTVASVRDAFMLEGGGEKSAQIALAKLLTWRSVFTVTLRDLAAAEVDLQEGVALARQTGASEYLATSLGWQALIAGRRQQYAHMEELAQEGLAVARAADLPIIEARMLNHLGSAANRQGAYAKAESLLHQGLKIYQQLKHHLYIDLTSAFLAEVMLKRGDFTQAKTYVQMALDTQDGIGSQHRRHELYNLLGEAACAMGEYPEAQAYYEQGVAFCQGTGLGAQQAPSLIGLGIVARIQGNISQAKTYLKQALEHSQNGDLFEYITASTYQLGLVALADSNIQLAQRYFKDSYAEYQKSDLHDNMALALCGLGQAKLMLDDPPASREMYIEALALAPIDAEPVLLEVLSHLAANYLKSGQLELGREMLTLVLRRPTAMAATRQFAQIVGSTHGIAAPIYTELNGSTPMLSQTLPPIFDQLPEPVRTHLL